LDIPRAYQFGDWRVEPHLNRVSRGDDDKPLQPKAMDVLVYLLEGAGEIVTMAELLDRGWQGRNVEENAVQQRISMIRQTLGDDAKHPRYIEHIAKRGYRTIASVSSVGASINTEAATLATSRQVGWGRSEPLLAVLPFDDLSENSDLLYFSDGVSEEIFSDRIKNHGR
jgi:DNA-binding winged helix-turn-helix (wHTH) protein